MPYSARRVTTALLLVAGLLTSLLLVVGTAPGAEAGVTGKVRGNISGAQGSPKKVQLLWFTKGWTYLGKRTFRGGGYSMSLPPGTYHLQFVDQRPAYDTAKYAPTDVKVTVRSNSTTVRNARMHQGAAITGTVRNGKGLPARNARVVAANAAEQSFPVNANKQGQFALGGLPQGSYSVFFYDAGKNWVTKKSTWVPGLKPGESKNLSVKMNVAAGALTVDLYTPTGQVGGHPYVTAISRSSGQFWTARAAHGSVVFRGLREGRYKVVVPGSGVWFAKSGPVKNGLVKKGRMAFGSFRLTQRGAWVSGTVVDGANNAYPLEDAQVLLKDTSGHTLAKATTDDQGGYRFDGQLATQTGLRVVAGPGPYTDFLKGKHNCKFTTASYAPLAIRAGRQSTVPVIALPRLPVAQQDDKFNCLPEDPDAALSR